MIETFDIDSFDDHLIIENNGLKVLVDTGSPVSICNNDSFLFMGHEYRCHTSLLGNNIINVSELLNYSIDVLMGMDIIGNYYFLIDYERRKVSFSSNPFELTPMYVIPLLRGHGGYVYIYLTIKDRTVKLALDTGAKISYIDKSITEGETMIEERNDFHPLIGHFQTPIYPMEAFIGEKNISVNFGNLPSLLATSLIQMGIDGVIGFDLFNAFRVLLDFKNNQLHILD